jgi:hypothetical protein
MTTLPDAKGLTAIEAWILTCIALVLAALGEYALILYLSRSRLFGQMPKRKKVSPMPSLRPSAFNIVSQPSEKMMYPDETADETYARRVKLIDLTSLIVFPLLFVLYNICYWTSH